tara:strand:+ start:122 stop:397 length:276 start_codon:yes stop_codon:yes gene_type:complete
MEIGNAIKEIRKRRGFSQQELAEKCELAVNSLCQIEINNSFPKKNNIKKICDALGVPVSYLLFFSVTEEDVPKDKLEVFKALAGLKDLLIE